MTRGELAGSWSRAASRGPKGADDGHLDLSASKERLAISEDGRHDQQPITNQQKIIALGTLVNNMPRGGN
jgi:hypothetical protein